MEKKEISFVESFLNALKNRSKNSVGETCYGRYERCTCSDCFKRK